MSGSSPQISSCSRLSHWPSCHGWMPTTPDTQPADAAERPDLQHGLEELDRVRLVPAVLLGLQQPHHPGLAQLFGRHVAEPSELLALRSALPEDLGRLLDPLHHLVHRGGSPGQLFSTKSVTSRLNSAACSIWAQWPQRLSSTRREFGDHRHQPQRVLEVDDAVVPAVDEQGSAR